MCASVMGKALSWTPLFLPLGVGMPSLDKPQKDYKTFLKGVSINVNSVCRNVLSSVAFPLPDIYGLKTLLLETTPTELS